MQSSHTIRRLSFAFGSFGLATLLLVVPAQASVGSLNGRILDVGSGLPVAHATVDLERSGSRDATAVTHTGEDGAFAFSHVEPQSYSLLVIASGYQITEVPSIVVSSGQLSQVQTAIDRLPNGIATIGHVVVTGSAALQGSATIHATISPKVLQAQNYMRAGDALSSVLGVNTSTSSSVGDDMSLSIRGFDPTETATLLDGHPIGPIGAFGFGYDYQVSPFFGLRNINVTYGSGATGIFGAPTMAGAVDFQTLSPTRRFHATFEQGAGNNAKLLTGLQFTGSVGRVGFAFSHGVSGTVGSFAPQQITQSGLLSQNVGSAAIAANTYGVDGTYLLHNDLGKLIFHLTPVSNLALTFYGATSWDSKSGNGDNDYNTYAYQLYNTDQGLAAGNLQSVTLPNGSTVTCSGNLVASISNAPTGYSCFTDAQYAAQTSGPAGGGFGPWQAIRNQDYNAQYSMRVGRTNFTLDSFVDNYAVDYNRSAAGSLDPTGTFSTGGFNSNYFRTSGLRIGDEFVVGPHDIGFGYYALHQRHSANSFPFFDANGNAVNQIYQLPVYSLGYGGVYASDTYTPNLKTTVFATLWVRKSSLTGTNEFDPRLSFIDHFGARDVGRITFGRASSEPDPSLIQAPPQFNATPQNLNPTCDGNQQSQIGSVSNRGLTNESSTDVEAAYGHRISLHTTLEADIYQSSEENALFSGTLPLTALGQTQVPASLLAQYLTRIAALCPNIANPSAANLSVATTYNAATARYRGFDLKSHVGLLRGLSANLDYGVQSASYSGVPTSILAQNPYVNNDAQILGIPLRKANVGIEYRSVKGFDARIDEHFIDTNNSLNRPAFWYATANVSFTGPRGVTINLGANNLFNNAAQIYGFKGGGVFAPSNAIAGSQGATGLQEGREEYGLPYRQIWVTLTSKL